jgi:mannose-1-phosphate guanylyltransferase
MNRGPIQPDIMAGGAGARPWPPTRTGCLKQFLVLHDNESQLQQAAQGVLAVGQQQLGVISHTVTSPVHRFLILDRLRGAHRASASPLLLVSSQGHLVCIPGSALAARGVDRLS